MSARDLKRLAESVIDRRSELKLTQEEFALRGGINVKTVTRVEKGQIDPRVKTLGALDRAAGWASGSARGILEDGRPPTLLDDLGDLYKQEPRDEVEQAILDLDDLPKDNQWAAIVKYRKKNADKRRRQDSPLDQPGA
jgi:transcriptional regulator with XRE-family HTH domain